MAQGPLGNWLGRTIGQWLGAAAQPDLPPPPLRAADRHPYRLAGSRYGADPIIGRIAQRISTMRRGRR